jgi:hypothetical protein
MKNKFYLITLVLLLFACNAPSKNETLSVNTQNSINRFKFSSLEILTFSDLKFSKNSNQSNLKLMNPDDMKKWSNHFNPKEIFEQELYEGYYYSLQDSSESYQLISIFCSTDDKVNLYLVTIKPNTEQIIDFFEVGTQSSQFIESKKNMEIYENLEASAKKISKNHYEIIRKTETHFDFQDENKNDSIKVQSKKLKIKISEKGYFSEI